MRYSFQKTPKRRSMSQRDSSVARGFGGNLEIRVKEGRKVKGKNRKRKGKGRRKGEKKRTERKRQEREEGRERSRE